MSRIPPRVPGQPVRFNTARRTINNAVRPPDVYSSEGYNPSDDKHTIQDAPNPNNRRTILSEWTKPIKKEDPTARKKVTPTKAKRP